MISDHVAITPDVQSQFPAPFYDPFISLGWLAAATYRIELGTTVIILPYRHPLLTARMAANIDRLSDGRFVLGVGVGWAKQEFEALGIPFERRGGLQMSTWRRSRSIGPTISPHTAGSSYPSRMYTVAPDQRVCHIHRSGLAAPARRRSEERFAMVMHGIHMVFGWTGCKRKAFPDYARLPRRKKSRFRLCAQGSRFVCTRQRWRRPEEKPGRGQSIRYVLTSKHSQRWERRQSC